MKTLIITAAISFITLAATAQGRYYSLQECGRDSLKYIERNYEDNMSRYIGKTVAYFVNECELTLEDFTPDIYTAFEGVQQENHNKIIGLFFDFYQDDYRYTIFLFFNPPYIHTRNDFSQIESRDYIEAWQEKYYNFFKNYIIKDMSILKQKDGKTLKNYRRP